MAFQQSIESINYFAVLVAALSAFVFDGLWYSVLFGKAWMVENGFTEDTLKKGSMGKIFSLLIVGIADSSMNANGLQNMIIIPTSLLAGCLFPLETMPEAMLRIADFLPQYWLLDTYDKLQQGASIESIIMNIAILLAFALTFSLLAIYRFGRNSNVRSFV